MDQTETFSIHVDPSGSLQDLATGITAALATRHPSVTASVTSEGRLRIASSDPDLTFTFAGDASGVLAGLGLGTFFTGRSASEFGINQAVEDETRLIATGRGDGPTDSSNIAAIAALRDAKLLDNDGASLEEYYQGVVGALGVNRAQARDLLENQRTVDDHLLNERSALSGVNIDDESLDLIRYQRAYQGAARFLSVIDTLLEALLDT
jgi:flagellar hook-associated protein 1 FlgK